MIGESVSHYRIIEKLGEGGMGVVYKAEDLRLDRPVALKFLTEASYGKEHLRTRFRREARTAASFNHPNICTIHEVDEQDGLAFIVMEFIEGENLRAKIRSGPLDVDDALDVDQYGGRRTGLVRVRMQCAEYDLTPLEQAFGRRFHASNAVPKGRTGQGGIAPGPAVASSAARVLQRSKGVRRKA